MKKHLALITWNGLPEGAESERLMLPYLAAAGVETEIIDWRSSAFDFRQFDLLVLRSCWDYHLRGDEFTEWLRSVAREVPVLNDVPTVLWNHSKFYLRELERQGIEIAPTVFNAGGAAIGAEERSNFKNWPKVVVKPAVSASAHKTWLLDGVTLPTDAELARQMGSEPFLIQQFIPEIQTHGEISFIYIDGIFSHAVLKRPAALYQANHIASTVPQVRDSLYCRIDAVARDGKVVLMELELIEPELFLGLAEGAPERFAEAIASRFR